MSIKPMLGKRFGTLFVKEITNKRDSCGSVIYLCKCDCGIEKLMSQRGIAKSLSCGCKRIERTTTHGRSKTPIYKAWVGMRERCLSPSIHNYHDYGGRGIKVCDRWTDKINGFSNFLEDMGEKPTKEHSLDRIDVNGNYEPSNCRWATRKEQNRNMRKTVRLEYNGEVKGLSDWAEIKGISRSLLSLRLHYGWSIERAIETPVRSKRKHNV